VQMRHDVAAGSEDHEVVAAGLQSSSGADSAQITSLRAKLEELELDNAQLRVRRPPAAARRRPPAAAAVFGCWLDGWSDSPVQTLTTPQRHNHDDDDDDDDSHGIG
jgi:hypothetical protein